MSGFFTAHEIKKVEQRKRTIPLCGRCKLNKKCSNPKLKPIGRNKKNIMIIGEQPSTKEDSAGKLLFSSGTAYLKTELKKRGIDLKNDCVKLNAVACSTRSKEQPSKAQIESCQPIVQQAIKDYTPHTIIVLGKVALDSLLLGRLSDIGPLTKWRGDIIPDREIGAFIVPTYHPNYIRNEKTPIAELFFSHDIDKAVWTSKRQFPKWQDEAKNVKILNSTEQIISYLKDLIKRQPPFIAFDYETTGLKPQKKGHKIVSLAIAEKAGHAVSFLVKNRVIPYIVKLLKNRKIKKIAANMKYEDMWSKILFKIEINGWLWDAMIAEHLLDNRAGVTGLKHQAYVHYGVLPYDNHIEEYWKSPDKKKYGANAFNQIHKIDTHDLLIYNGLDAIYELQRALDQMKLFGILDPVMYARQMG